MPIPLNILMQTEYSQRSRLIRGYTVFPFRLNFTCQVVFVSSTAMVMSRQSVHLATLFPGPA